MPESRVHSFLISPRRFIAMIGGDYELLRKSGWRTLLRFYLSALLIFIILVISWLSIFYATSYLSHSFIIELGLAAFISVLFVFIYIFLLHTFSKNTLEGENIELEIKEKDKWNPFFRLTNLIRLGFVILMGFLISKPIEVFIYKKQLSERTNQYRQLILMRFTNRIEKLYNNDILKIEKDIDKYKGPLSQAYPDTIKRLNELKKAINNIKAKSIQKATERINHSQFLIYRIKQVATIPMAWLCCAIIVILFILPGFLIYSISSNNTYYSLNRNKERQLISDQFKKFKIEYQKIFKSKYEYELEYYTEFMDPPFNTKKKLKPNYSSQADFINKHG